jgi:putative ABC transport system permease protein
MNIWKLAIRSLLFYRRTNIGVLLSVLVATAVLTGALLTGDSVRFSLAQMARSRLGKTQLAISAQNRFFTEELAGSLSAELDVPVAAVLNLRGLITGGDNSKDAARVNVFGVERRFFELAPDGIVSPAVTIKDDFAVLNEPLAKKMDVFAGGQIVLRIEKPATMPREAALTPVADLTAGYRLTIGDLAGAAQFGRFSLQAEQLWPLNVFVPLDWLQEKAGRPGQVNLLLAANNDKGSLDIETAENALKKNWRIEDAELELRRLDKQGVWELRSKKVFIDSVLGQAALGANTNSTGILSYFVNEIKLGDKATPYSMITAMGKTAGSIIPLDMQDDEVIISQWLADDLAAKAGDRIELSYFAFDSMRKIREQSTSFRIRRILPMDSPTLDRELMPDFPGLADVNNCRDWEPGIEIDLNKIRDKDQQYWDNYKGTPKAFITLSAGQKIWVNRYGDLTAVRYPLESYSRDDIVGSILSSLEPASAGLFFQPVARQAEAAMKGSTDFGSLFLGLSMFVIISALILTSLVFIFGVESRSEETGLLLAVGFEPALVRRLLLIEGLFICIFGAIAGIAAGLLYTRLVVLGLSTVWSGAVGFSQILFHAEPSSLVIGIFCCVAISLGAIRLSLRRLLKRPARQLMAGGLRWEFSAKKIITKDTKDVKKAVLKSNGRIGILIAATASIGAIILIFMTSSASAGSASGTFFLAGALLLIAAFGFTDGVLKIIAVRTGGVLTGLGGLGLRNSTRRRGRSLAVVMLLACGVFMVIAVSANKTRPPEGTPSRDSGTGGFALYGQTSIPLLQKLDSSSAIKALGLDEKLMQGVTVVNLRVHQGDDASCLNLNRPQTPQVLGVDAEQLKNRGSFSFAGTIKVQDANNSGWGILIDSKSDPNVIPAAGDYNTIMWALGKKLGDFAGYVDDRGRPFQLQIAAMVKSSILQGSLIISEEEFIRRFPSDEGYRIFLIDVPQDKAAALAGHLTIRLADYAMELTSSNERLAGFMALENTYLSIFGLLGALGLVLGSVGLALVVLRNVLERRCELAMLRAVGFNKGSIKKLLIEEHAGIALCGLFFGTASALLAITPALKERPAQMPFITIIAIAASAIFWVWLAASIAMRGDFINALRDE